MIKKEKGPCINQQKCQKSLGESIGSAISYHKSIISDKFSRRDSPIISEHLLLPLETKKRKLFTITGIKNIGTTCQER
jgi:hypothetical protein